MKNKSFYQLHFNSFILSYAQIFFSTNKISGAILFVVSFIDFWSGMFGALSVVVSLFIANRLGFDKKHTQSGLYSYNSLLTGLGIGLYYEPSFALLIFTIVISLIVLLLSIGISKFMANYGLPFLSIPFLLGIWMVDLSGNSFNSLGLSGRSIYNLNQIYGLGGTSLVAFYEWISTIPILYSLEVYFLSLGAIFFQYQLVAGVIISIALIIHSRISFLLSLIGFYAAWLFYFALGASLYDLSYSYIGFNFILTAVALGGFYLIPNRYSFGWMLFILPAVVLATLASMSLFANFKLGIYALPFNMIVILFIYVNKFRIKEKFELKEVLVQHYSPEKNLYYSLQAEKRFTELKYLPIGLPINGEWTISQAHNGSITHQDKWKHAWDFVITNKDGKQYNNDGDYTTDYLCFGKNVIATYDGIIQEVSNGIEDNIIGENNLRNNWGNTIIIKHTEYLYSKYSHLQKESIQLKKGDYIRKGQIIAKIGNSGRSPYPHLHFQLQQTPYIGSETLEYPISSYISKNKVGEIKLHLYEFPKLEEHIEKPTANELMTKALKWDVGREMVFEIKSNNKTSLSNWYIHSDIYKNTYIYCADSESYAYFYNDGQLSYFKNFSGNQSSALYQFFLAFNKIHNSFYQGIILEDDIALHLSKQTKWKMILQDFLAPFFIFLRTKFQIKYIKMDDELSPTLLHLQSDIKYYEYKKISKVDTYEIKIHDKGYIEFKNNKTGFHAVQKQ
ncbi:MAG: peptidoglycan DD-metalloendopeptidase family protein [Bacteroidales bacterium]|nr:peptidoglycan DD-metalloendopeptidase family protein [Bacteroidales bacterium]